MPAQVNQDQSGCDYTVTHANVGGVHTISVVLPERAGFNIAAVLTLIQDIISKQPISVIIADVLAIFSE